MYIENNIDFAQSQPTTLNYLRPANFHFQIDVLPRTMFSCQMVNIPNITIGAAKQVTPTIDIPVYGDKLEFGNLNITFMVAEDMSNYREIYNWIIKIAGDNINKYTDAEFMQNLGRYPKTGMREFDQHIYSDASLHVISSTNNVVAKINFIDLIPVSLESVPFDITDINQGPLLAVASFKYRLYELEPVNV